MAKQPETVDRFEIVASVSKDQLGHVMAALITAGIPPEMLQSRMVTDVLNYKGGKKFDTSALDFGRAWVADHPTFKRTEIVKHFVDSGRTKESASGVVHRLRELGEIRALGDGNYQRKDVKAITGPKKKVKVKLLNKRGQPITRSRRGNSVHHYDVPNREFLLKRITGRAKITVRELEEVFTSNGRNPKSVSALLSLFVKEKKVKHLEQGTYGWVGPKVKKVRLTPRVPPTAKPNGSAIVAPAAETVTNG